MNSKGCTEGNKCQARCEILETAFEALLRTKLVCEEAQERNRQIQAPNDTKTTFFRVEYPVDDSTPDEAIDAACSDMSEVILKSFPILT